MHASSFLSHDPPEALEIEPVRHVGGGQTFRAAASEFPNDNFALHSGVIWVLETIGGELVAEHCEVAQAPEPVEIEVPAPRYSEVVPRGTFEIEGDDEEDDESIIVEPIEPFESFETTEISAVDSIATIKEVELEPLIEPVAEMEVEPPPPRSTHDGFESFVAALADVALSAGDHAAAAAIRPLLVDGVVPETLGAGAVDALSAGSVLFAATRRATESFDTIRKAWRALLREESDDMSACGGAMLDEWAADLVARAMGDPAIAGNLRRELRSRGVAAFGMIEAA